MHASTDVLDCGLYMHSFVVLFCPYTAMIAQILVISWQLITGYFPTLAGGARPGEEAALAYLHTGIALRGPNQMSSKRQERPFIKSSQKKL